MRDNNKQPSLAASRWAHADVAWLLSVVSILLTSPGWTGCSGTSGDGDDDGTPGRAGVEDAPGVEPTPELDEPPIETDTVEQTAQIEATGCPDAIESVQDEALGDLLTNPSMYCDARDARPMPTGDWSCIEISSERCPDAHHHLECRRPLTCRVVPGAEGLVEVGVDDSPHGAAAPPLLVEATGCPRALLARQEIALRDAVRNPAPYCGDAHAVLVGTGADWSCVEVPSDRCSDSPHHLDCTIPVSCQYEGEADRPPAAARGWKLPEVEIDTCQAYHEKLRRCLPYQCRISHPLVDGFVIDREIVKKSGEVCVTTETMPGGILQQCRIPLPDVEPLADFYQWTRETGGVSRTRISMRDGEVEVHSYKGDREVDTSVLDKLQEHCSVSSYRDTSPEH